MFSYIDLGWNPMMVDMTVGGKRRQGWIEKVEFQTKRERVRCSAPSLRTNIITIIILTKKS